MTSSPDLAHLSLTPRAVLDTLETYSAGRDAASVRRDSGYVEPIIKLASNEGAEGPFAAAQAALAESRSAAQRYPAAFAAPLCDALARFHAVTPDQVMVSNGGCSLLAHLSSVFLDPGDEVVFGRPTFHLYRLEALRMGAVPVSVPVNATGSYDLTAMQSAIGPRTRLLYVCTPNNPTGGLVRRDELAQFLADLPERVLPIIDEAYFEYVEDSDFPDPIHYSRPCARPTVVIRTFSKIYGLAGLRIGYAIAPAEVVASCRKIQNPYEVNCDAQLAALASLAHPEELAQRRAANRVAREHLVCGLRNLGLDPLPSQANFACVRVGDGRTTAVALESEGIIVRPLAAMGDPQSIRVTVGTLPQMDAFLRVLANVLRLHS